MLFYIECQGWPLMTFGHKPEGTELCGYIYGKSILDRGKSKYKALRQECPWKVYATAVTAGQLKDYRVFNQSNEVWDWSLGRVIGLWMYFGGRANGCGYSRARTFCYTPCFLLYYPWYLDMVHSLFCFAPSNTCALFSCLDFSSKNCQLWKMRRRPRFSSFCLSNADFISVFLKENFLWGITKSQFKCHFFGGKQKIPEV